VFQSSDYDEQKSLKNCRYKDRAENRRQTVGSEGTFQRDDLLAHLEKQAKEHPDRDDLVPYTGEKRGEKRPAFRTMGTFDPVNLFVCFHLFVICPLIMSKQCVTCTVHHKLSF